MNAVTATPNSATAPLWERTRAMFGRAVAAVGAPAAIAALTLLSRAARGDIIRWLLLLESIVRKLLLADAGALPPPPKQTGPRLILIPLPGALPASQAVAAKPTREGARVRSIDFTQPETWAAQFPLSLPCISYVPESRAPRIRALWGPPLPPPPPPPAPRRRHPMAFLIALRFEAIRRVLNDPLPHVRRLAEALRAAVRRCANVVTRYFRKVPAKYHYDAHDPRLHIAALGQAYNATFAFADTS